MITDLSVMFLDEPTTGLDPRSRHEVWAAVPALRDSGLTVRYLDEADAVADRIAVIDGGRVVAHGTADAVRALLDELSVRGVAVERITLHRPTLDEVFLALTGIPESALVR